MLLSRKGKTPDKVSFLKKVKTKKTATAALPTKC